MRDCPECVKARTRWRHRVYIGSCLCCGIRALALATPQEREAKLEELEFVCGRAMRAEAVRMLRLESARIESLKGAPND